MSDRDKWQPISTAPRDGTRVWLYVAGDTCGWEDPAMHLPPFQCEAAYHPEAGWCVDELREATHWRPLPPPPKGDGE